MWKQDVIDGAVADVIKEVIKNEKFEKAIRSKIESGLDTDDLEKEAQALNKQLRQLTGAKDKLNTELDRLDVTDKHYNRKYEDMTGRLEGLYDQMDAIEGQIDDIETRILHIKEEKISSDGVYQYLLYFDKLYDQFTDKEKKEFYNCLIESVEIYEQPLESGRILKKIVFRFPLLYGEEEITGISWNKVNHVETIVLLSKLDSKKYISVELPMDDMDLTSAESKATYKQIQNYVLEKFGFKVSTLYIAQVKKKHGLEVREHYNISKNENQKVPQCSIEKEEAILDALKYFKMIKDGF